MLVALFEDVAINTPRACQAWYHRQPLTFSRKPLLNRTFSRAPYIEASDVTIPIKTMSFNIKFSKVIGNGPRLGNLSTQTHNEIKTPHYIALSSRGAIPHISQDMLHDNTAVRGVFVALEDCECIE